MKTVELKCKGCGKSFLKQKNEHTRQTKKGKDNFYCSLKCQAVNDSQRKIHKNIERECVFCKSKFISTTHKRYRKCCSNDCARRYSQSFVDVEKISRSLKKYYEINPIETKIVYANTNVHKTREKKPREKKPCKVKIMEIRKCVICSNEFFKFKSLKGKTCSKECRNELLRKKSTNNPNCGGETNYRKYQYNGVWMDSTWEVEIAKWMDDNNIKWKRDRTMMFSWTDLTGKKRRYYPDFYLTDFNMYLDPKNKYLLKKDNFKLNQVIKENKINLIYGLKSDIIDQLKKLV